MNAKKIKTGLVGVMLICASAHAAAQVCEREKQQLKAEVTGEGAQQYLDYFMDTNKLINEKIPYTMGDFANYVEYGCPLVNIPGRRSAVSPSAPPICNEWLNNGVKPPRSGSPNYRAALLVMVDAFTNKANSFSSRGPEARWHRESMLLACVARHMVAQVDAAPVRTASNANRPSPANPNLPASPATAPVQVERPAPMAPQRPTAAEARQLTAQLNEAVGLALQRQADVDRRREGKPKRHVLGREAHKCLKPQPGGGVVNDCPYAIEYSYCVYHPTKDSWSAFFDCEKTKGGAWQIGPGPNARSILHTDGEMTYWFACRYGETLAKPDGISPTDIEFQRGRGILGRCAEWGSGHG